MLTHSIKHRQATVAVCARVFAQTNSIEKVSLLYEIQLIPSYTAEIGKERFRTTLCKRTVIGKNRLKVGTTQHTDRYGCSKRLLSVWAEI